MIYRLMSASYPTLTAVVTALLSEWYTAGGQNTPADALAFFEADAAFEGWHDFACHLEREGWEVEESWMGEVDGKTYHAARRAVADQLRAEMAA